MDSKILSQMVKDFRANDKVKDKAKELIKEIYKDIDIVKLETEDDLRLVEAEISRAFISCLEFEMCMHLMGLIGDLKTSQSEPIQRLVVDVMSLGFHRNDAEEVVDIIVKLEGENIEDIVRMWEEYGARWVSEEELVECINSEEKEENKETLEQMLSSIYFYRLKSGLIISWRY